MLSLKLGESFGVFVEASQLSRFERFNYTMCKTGLRRCGRQGGENPRALGFLKGSLHFTDAEVDLLKSDRVKFLETYIHKFYEYQQFTNIQAIGFNLSFGSGGSDELPVEFGLKQLETNQGGSCVMSSFGSCFILQALGLDAYVSWVYTENRPGFEVGHFVCVVRNLAQEGDTYLMDYGTRISPLPHIIPLHTLQNDGDSSELFHSYYMVNQFYRIGDKVHRKTCKDYDTEQFLFYRIDPIPPVVDLMTEDKSQLKFSLFPHERLSRPNKGSGTSNSFWMQALIIIGFPDHKPQIFRNNEHMYQDAEGKLARRILGTQEELVAAIREAYPAYAEKLVQSAIAQVWKYFKV